MRLSENFDTTVVYYFKNGTSLTVSYHKKYNKYRKDFDYYLALGNLHCAHVYFIWSEGTKIHIKKKYLRGG